MYQEIENNYNFRDLLYFIFKKWRTVLFWILLGAILFGLATVVFSKNEKTSIDLKERDQEKNIEETTGLIDEAIGAEQVQALETFILNNNPEILQINSEISRLQKNNTLLSNTLLTDLFLSKEDNREFIFSLDFKINLLGETISDDLASERIRLLTLEYINNLENDSFSSFIAKKTDQQIPQEQVSNLLEFLLEDDHIVKVKIIAPQSEMLEEFVQFFKAYLEKEMPSKLILPYPHTLEITNEKTTSQFNLQLEEKRKELESEIDSTYLTLKEKQEELAATTEKIFKEEKQDYVKREGIIIDEDLLQAEEIAKEEMAESLEMGSVGFSYSSLARNIIIGAIVFGGLACLFIFFKVASIDTFTDSSILSKQLGLMYIGEIVKSPVSSNKARLGESLDKFIYKQYIKKKNIGTKNSTVDSDYISTYLMNAYNVQEDKDITSKRLGVIAEITEEPDVVYEDLEEKITDSNFSLTKVTLPINEEKALMSLNQAKSCILILRPRKSKLTDIIRAVELCHEFKIDIVGIVSLESP